MSARAQDYCIFRRGGAGFALSTSLAKEVVELKSFTMIPAAPPELIGAFNLRGEIVPLVSLDSLIDATGSPAQRGDALLVIGSSDLRFATGVDELAAVQHFAPWEIRRDASGAGLVLGSAGALDDPVTVLDGERLVAAVLRRIGEGFRGASASRLSPLAARSGIEPPATALPGLPAEEN